MVQTGTPRALRHRIVETTLAGSAVEDYPRIGGLVLGFVDERIAAMPAHIRVGILLTEWLLVLQGMPADPTQRLRRLSASRLPPIVQYIRLIRSLVLLSAHEFAEEREGAVPW